MHGPRHYSAWHAEPEQLETVPEALRGDAGKAGTNQHERVESGMCAVALRQSRSGVSRVRGACKAAISGYIEPCDPTLREKPPRGGEWVYEIKADGYRTQLHLLDGEAKAYSRTGYDWSKQFSSIVAAAQKLKANSAIIDGEAVVYGSSGLPDFQQLRRELGAKRSDRIRYHAFDLLYFDGYDLRGVAHVERKRLLQQLLKDAPETFVYVEHIAAEGEEIFRNACKLGLEGLVAKRVDAPYRSGRQETWLKLKCKKSQTFPIIASSRSWARIRAKWPLSTSAGTSTGSCCTPARFELATPKRQPANCASVLIR